MSSWIRNRSPPRYRVVGGLPVVQAPVQTAPAVGVAAGGGDRLPEEPEAEGALQVLGLHHHGRPHGAGLLNPRARHQVPATQHIATPIGKYLPNLPVLRIRGTFVRDPDPFLFWCRSGSFIV